MDFILFPVITGIITLGIYGLFELIIRRKERLLMIEKISDKITPDMVTPSISLPSLKSDRSYGSLKVAGLLMGLGLGLLVGFFICYFTLGIRNESWEYRNMREIIIGASTIMGGGFGLLMAFIVELKLTNKK